MKRLFVYILILCVTTVLSAQTYSGSVVEKKGEKPIVGVSVSLVSSDGLLVAWGYSDDKGMYKVTLPAHKRADKIHFSFLGYRKISILLADFPSDGRIVMESEDFQLEEVRISANRIIEKQDTLVYTVAGFSQPQDRSIADVIAKMPGMEVAPNGQISFNGKNINKFYIEGMDLMNDRYSLASNNISKKRVKYVEILQNHQPIELLRGKSFSEQAAVNLVLEDNSKLNVVGSADLGVGMNGDDVLYNNRLLAMLFGKKNQTLSIYKNDNTGYDLFTEINPLTLADLNREDMMEEGMISLVTTHAPDVDRSRYTFNQSHLVATNHLFQLAEKTNIRTQISYFDDVSDRNNVIATEYLFTDTLRQTKYEDNALHERKKRLDMGVNFEMNRPDMYLKNELKGTLDWVSAQSLTQWNGNQRHLSSGLDRKFFSDVLDIKLPLSGDRYISIVSTNNYNQHPQRLTLFSNDTQLLDYASFRTHTSASFRHRLLGMYATYQTGFHGLFQSLKTAIAEQDVIKKQCFERYMPYIGTGLNYQNATVNLSANVEFHWMHWNLEKTKNASFYPEVKLVAKYMMSGTSSISMNYQHSKQLQDLKQVYEGDLFTSYRTVVNNGQVLEENGTHRLSLRYQYSQPIKGLFFSLSTSVSNSRQNAAYMTSLLEGEEVLIRKKQKADFNTKMYLTTARFSKSFHWWKSLLAFSGSYIRSEDAQFSGKILQDYDMDNCMATVSFSARPLSFLSFEWGTIWQQNRVKSSMIDSKVNRLKHQLDLTFPVTQRLQLSLNNTVCQSLATNDNSWFADFSAKYVYKKVEFRIDINNILGKSVLEREFISSVQKNAYRYLLRPRDIICKALFSF